MPEKHMIRVALMGDGGVGKTSLRKQFMGQGFTATHMMTIGADFAVHRKEIEGEPVLFQIWDLAGQETYSSVRARFFRGSMAGICVFDITRPDSFHNVANWVEELWRQNGKGVVPVMILANKSDLRKPDSVPILDVQKYANAISEITTQYGFHVYFLETSAKNGENVEEAFTLLGAQVIDAIKRGVLQV